MRIVHCISSLSGGGAERQLSYLAPCLADKGLEIHIAYLTEGLSPPARELLANIHLHQIIHKNNYDPLIIWRFFILFRKIRPDLIQTWIPQIDILAGIAARACRLPWILREPNNEKSHRGWKAWLRKRVAGYANHVVANSSGGKAYWERICPSLSCSVIYNGLPRQVFVPSTKPGQQLRKKNHIIFAGRLVRQKNILLLLNAARTLLREFDFTVSICGTGELHQKALEFVRHHDLEKQILFHGHVTQKRLLEMFREGSLLVSPSLHEGCPNIVLEAMANSCPVAVSSIPAHTDILDEASAFFFDPGDQAALEKIIRNVLTHPEQAYQKALNARKIAENFSLDKMVDAYLDLYQKILART